MIRSLACRQSRSTLLRLKGHEDSPRQHSAQPCKVLDFREFRTGTGAPKANVNSPPRQYYKHCRGASIRVITGWQERLDPQFFRESSQRMTNSSLTHDDIPIHFKANGALPTTALRLDS